MENIKYNYIKCFVICSILYLLFFTYSLLTTDLGVRFEVISHLQIAALVSPIIWYIFYQENKGKSQGFHMNSEGVLIIHNSKKFQCSWNDLKVKRSFRIFNKVLHMSLIINVGNKNKKYPLLICTWNDESAISLIRKYAPVDHEVYKLAAIYANNKERFKN